MQSGRKLPFDIMPTKRAFYSACNSIIAHSNGQMNFRSLQEKYSLYVDAHVQDAPIKSTPYNLLPITYQRFNFVTYCRSIERLYQHIFAKLYFATVNSEKDTVN